MERLAARDLEVLQESIRGIYSTLDLKAFQDHVISTLPQVIRAEVTSYNEVNPLARRNQFQAAPSLDSMLPDGLAIFNRHITEHPLIRHYEQTRDTRPLKISDFLTQRQFHRLGLYNEFFRRLGLEYQLAVTLPTPPPTVVGIAFNRGRPDFSERERSILHLLRPHLVQGYQNAVMVSQLRETLAATLNALDELHDGVILLGRTGQVLAATRRAVDLLRQYFGESPHGERRLPEELARWVRHHDTRLKDQGMSHRVRTPFVVECADNTLVVRLMTDAEESVLIMKEQGRAFPTESLTALGLTRREAEVLGWVIRGKTNDAIGTVLQMSRHTVANHLQHIYEKLGVATRTAAATRALELVTGGRLDSRE
jgi:DNA-binding CsgD family transcriptional regulator